MTEVGVNSAATKHHIDLAIPANFINSTKYSSQLTSVLPSSSLVPTSSLISPKIISETTQAYHQPPPYRRITRSLSCPTDSSIARTAPKQQRTRRDTSTQALFNDRKEKSKNAIPLSMITQGFYTTESPTKDWIAQQSENAASGSAASTIDQVDNPPVVSPRYSGHWSYIDRNSAGKADSRLSLSMISCQYEPSTLARSTQDPNLSGSRNLSDELGGYNAGSNELYLKLSKDDNYKPPRSSKIGLSSVPGRRLHQSRLSSPPTSNKNFSSFSARWCEKRSTKDPAISEQTFKSEISRTNKSITMEKNCNKVNDNCKEQPESAPQTPTYQSLEVSLPDSQPPSCRQRILSSTAHQPSGIFSNRRSSISEFTPPIKLGNKQPKGSSTLYPYHSSPLSPHPIETNDTPELFRQVEDSESTVSTTPHSTVWDELEDLKSRIQRLEIGRKISPNHAGTEISRISHERPRTATTTLTSVSTSPHCEATEIKTPVEPKFSASIQDTHNLLKSALVKSKEFVDIEVYRALEATTNDALSISSMMGSSGQPGPIFKSQSNASNGFTTPVSDRQVRRKAESMCRSLTELCLALSDQIPAQDKEIISSNNHQSNSIPGHELVKPALTLNSPRTMSELEARRSSLLAPSISNTLTVTPKSEIPKKNGFSGRNMMLYRGSRAILNESNEEPNYRSPSRVFSDIHSIRNASKEKFLSISLSEKDTTSSTPTSMPHRTHQMTKNLSRKNIPISSLSGTCRDRDRQSIERELKPDIIMMSQTKEEQLDTPISLDSLLQSDPTHGLSRRLRPNISVPYSAGQKLRYL